MAMMIKDVSLHYPNNLSKTEQENEGLACIQNLKFGSLNPKKGNGRTILKVINASKSSSRNQHTINGKKINGVHVEEYPYLGQRGNDNNNVVIEKTEGSSNNSLYLLGNFVDDRFVYRQSFVIRSYEIGPDKTATMETIMNLLQETALNHVASSGVGGNGFGATREMSLRKLIWVVTRIQIQVEQYSSWGDVVEIDTWVDAAGKNGMRDWIIRDSNTRNIITKATSTWVIMNRETRRLSKIPEQVKAEVQPFYINRCAIPTEQTDSEKIEKLTDETAEIISSGLAPRWSDMDANQHVNNVKYIGWILESVPINVLEEYNLMSLTLEYRRECRLSNVLQSMTSMREIATAAAASENDGVSADKECTHLIRMEEDRAEVVRARSIWQTKQ
nr:PREDICTED: palmitoyl-acyl carrier protein thioesterase, chloroplastic-like [Nicotiana tabacum]